MDLLMAKVKYQSALCYMDDIVCFSTNFENHLLHIEEVLTLLRGANLKLKRSKCTFAVDSLQYLGFIISKAGISPSEEKCHAIRSFPTPKNVRDVRSFCGMAQFYRKFIKNFAGVTRPLYDLLKLNTKFLWSDACQEAFESLRFALTGDDIMVYPDFTKKFYLATDASDISIGATLQQYDDNGNLRPISFAGRSLKPAEKNYTVTHKELLAVVWAVEYFRVYLESDHFIIHTDHAALTHLMRQKSLTQRVIRWQVLLNGFDFDILHIKGKHNVIPDALSRRPFPETNTVADKRIEQFEEFACSLGVCKSVSFSLPSCRAEAQYVPTLKEYGFRPFNPSLVPVVSAMRNTPGGSTKLCVFIEIHFSKMKNQPTNRQLLTLSPDPS
jgi:hypothetical protein